MVASRVAGVVIPQIFTAVLVICQPFWNLLGLPNGINGGLGEMALFSRKTLALPIAVMLAACGVQEAMEGAGAEIDTFHARLNNENYDGIYDKTSSEFRSVTSQEEFEKLLSAIHGKLGRVESSKQNGWQANNFNGVSTIVIGMETTFEKGDAQETFTYLREGKELMLQGYNINSAALFYN